MPRPIALALSSLVLFSAPLPGQQPFEGIVTLQMTTAGMTMQPVVYVKGHRSRANMNMGGREMYLLTDSQKETMTMVMPAQRAFMAMDPEKLIDTTKTGELKPTGKNETIAGITCEHFVHVDGKNETDVCVARGMGTFLGIASPPGRGANRGMASILRRIGARFREGAFMLKVEIKEAGTTQTTFEVTKVERTSVDAALLTMPEGFQDMSGMMQGIPGRRPPQR